MVDAAGKQGLFCVKQGETNQFSFLYSAFIAA